MRNDGVNGEWRLVYFREESAVGKIACRSLIVGKVLCGIDAQRGLVASSGSMIDEWLFNIYTIL